VILLHVVWVTGALLPECANRVQANKCPKGLVQAMLVSILSWCVLCSDLNSKHLAMYVLCICSDYSYYDDRH